MTPAQRSAGRLLLVLAQHPRLQRKDVVEHAIGAATLQAVVRDQAAVAQQVAELESERTVDPDLALGQRVLQQLEAAVERPHTGPIAGVAHAVPRISTRPPRMRALTSGRAGSLK